MLSYGTRVQRFTVDIDPVTGAISKFRIVETVEFKNKLGDPLDGIAPGSALDAGNLGNSFDPEGLVVHPHTGNLLVSDEYGPSLYEFGRDGTLVARLQDPGEPQAGQRRRQLQLRRRRRHGPAHQSRLRGPGDQP